MRLQLFGFNCASLLLIICFLVLSPGLGCGHRLTVQLRLEGLLAGVSSPTSCQNRAAQGLVHLVLPKETTAGSM